MVPNFPCGGCAVDPGVCDVGLHTTWRYGPTVEARGPAQSGTGRQHGRYMSHGCDDGRQRRRRAAARELLRAELAPQGHNDFANALVAERDAVAYEFGANLLDILGGGQIQLAHGSEERKLAAAKKTEQQAASKLRRLRGWVKVHRNTEHAVRKEEDVGRKRKEGGSYLRREV